MGYDSTINLPQRVTPEEIVELFSSLGFYIFPYEGENAWSYGNSTGLYQFQKLFYPDDGGRQTLVVSLYRRGNKLKISTRLNLSCSYYDMESNNKIISLISKIYNCSFTTDHGRNTLFNNSGIDRRGSESICYNTFLYLQDSLRTIGFNTGDGVIAPSFPKLPEGMRIYGIESRRSEIFFPNIIVTYLISVVEEYFREMFRGILMYSPEKKSIFKDVRIKNEDFLLISDDQLDIYSAAVKWISFQNLPETHRYYKKLGIDIAVSLNKIRRDDKSAWEILEDLINQRHELVHSNIIDINYDMQCFRSDLKIIELGLTQMYEDIFAKMDWRAEGH